MMMSYFLKYIFSSEFSITELTNRYVKSYGGVCIADEVQVGFGRVGTHMWSFEKQVNVKKAYLLKNFFLINCFFNK